MYTLREAISLIRSQKRSAAEITELCVRRLARLKDLNAFITEIPEDAMETAKHIDESINQGLPMGSLAGVPIAVKDNYCVKNLLTSCASHMLSNFHSPYTATVVRRLQDEGAVLMGKTNMDEFGMGCGSVDSIYGPVRNPWNYDYSRGSDPDYSSWHIAGGSSGGSAVAVATGQAYIALGSDTGGSIRNPAALCGVIGFKPTYGRLSRHGLIPLVNSMDCPGILARNVDDTVTAFNLLAGHDILDSTTVDDEFEEISIQENLDMKSLKIGIPKEYYPSALSPEVARAWTDVADSLDNSGARVVDVSLPHTPYSLPCYSVLCACEVASNMARYDGLQYGERGSDDSSTEALYAETRHRGFNTVVRGRILAGNYFLLRSNYPRYFLQAQRIRQLIQQDFWNVFHTHGVDVLLTPTVLGDAPVYDVFSESDSRTRTSEQDVFTQSANMAGLPALSLPVTLSSRGLPISLQLMSRPFHESTMFFVSKWIEDQVSFPQLDLNYLFQE